MHINNVPPSTAPRPYACGYPGCTKTFMHQKHLDRHIAGHSGERAHVCGICGADFVRSDKLRRHMETHSEVRPYACEVCSRGFKRRSALKRHSAVHR